jgi:serine O-acetyltransferase
MMRTGVTVFGPVAASRRALLAPVVSLRHNHHHHHRGSQQPTAAATELDASFLQQQQPTDAFGTPGLFAATRMSLSAMQLDSRSPRPLVYSRYFNHAVDASAGATADDFNESVPCTSSTAIDTEDPDRLYDAVAEAIFTAKEADMRVRPSWRPPSLPTTKDVEDLLSRMRDIAFPEYGSLAECTEAAATNSLTVSSSSNSLPRRGNTNNNTNGERNATTAATVSLRSRGQVKAQLHDLTKALVDVLSATLIVDALDEDIEKLHDPDQIHYSKLGSHVRQLPRELAVALAENHARRVVVPAFLKSLPSVINDLNADADNILKLDVATTSRAEIVLSYPGVVCLLHHRVANALLNAGAPMVLCRLISEHAHSLTGIDIHPGVTIGPGCFIDHGTGLVIGATAEIGSNVCLFHGVTLGSRGFPVDANGRRIKHQKRHPIIEDGVSIYAGATVLGRIRIGAGAVIASGTTVVKNVEPGVTVAAPRTTPTFTPSKIVT